MIFEHSRRFGSSFAVCHGSRDWVGVSMAHAALTAAQVRGPTAASGWKFPELEILISPWPMADLYEGLIRFACFNIDVVIFGV